jgi:hypothetical protein
MTALLKYRFRPELDTLETRNVPSATSALPILSHGAAVPQSLEMRFTPAVHPDGLPIVTQTAHFAPAARAGEWHDGTTIEMRRPGRWGGIVAELNYVPKQGQTFQVKWGDGNQSACRFMEVGGHYYIMGFHEYGVGKFQTSWSAVQPALPKPTAVQPALANPTALGAYFASVRAAHGLADQAQVN